MDIAGDVRVTWRSGPRLHVFADDFCWWSVDYPYGVMYAVLPEFGEDLWGRPGAVPGPGRRAWPVALCGGYGVPDVELALLVEDHVRRWTVRQVDPGDLDRLELYRVPLCDPAAQGGGWVSNRAPRR